MVLAVDGFVPAAHCMGLAMDDRSVFCAVRMAVRQTHSRVQRRIRNTPRTNRLLWNFDFAL